jgi:hypothetical protein
VILIPAHLPPVCRVCLSNVHHVELEVVLVLFIDFLNAPGALTERGSRV